MSDLPSPSADTTLRRMTAADIDVVSQLTARVFAPSAVAGTAERLALAYRGCAFLPLDHCLLAERAGAIVGKWQMLDLVLRVGRARVRVAGAQGVLVDPAIDGEGVAWSMVPQGLDVLGELGHDVVVGFAQKGAAYAALGAMTIAAEHAWSLDAWRVPKKSRAGFREGSDEDAAHVVRFSEAAQEGRSASLVRTASMWPWIDRRPRVLWIADDGYVGIRDDATSVEVREIGGASPVFYRRALAALAAYAEERGVRRIRGELPPDHPLVRASLDVGAEIVTGYPARRGMMGLVLDAGSFLPRIESELRVRLAASRFADRAIELRVATTAPRETHARLRIGATEAARTEALTVQLTTTGGELAQLVFGYRGVAWLAENAVTGCSEALELADVLFPTSAPFLQCTDRW